MKIAITGGGNMGLAFARSFLKYNLVTKDNLLLIEKSSERCKTLISQNEGMVINTISKDIADYDLVVLAVKPQDFPVLASELNGLLKDHQVVLSIMAGIPIKKIQSAINHPHIIRAMPNTPAMLGLGITGFTSTDGIDKNKLFKIENLISATGRAVYMDDENMLDAVTALSGSGPAYFYYYVKHMVEAGVKMGFEENTALQFVKQTMLGAYHLINNADQSLDDLIKMVASRGGTTEAALKVFEDHNLGHVIQNGIIAAESRAKKLSNKI